MIRVPAFWNYQDLPKSCPRNTPYLLWEPPGAFPCRHEVVDREWLRRWAAPPPGAGISAQSMHLSSLSSQVDIRELFEHKEEGYSYAMKDSFLARGLKIDSPPVAVIVIPGNFIRANTFTRVDVW